MGVLNCDSTAIDSRRERPIILQSISVCQVISLVLCIMPPHLRLIATPKSGHHSHFTKAESEAWRGREEIRFWREVSKPKRRSPPPYLSYCSPSYWRSWGCCQVLYKIPEVSPCKTCFFGLYYEHPKIQLWFVCFLWRICAGKLLPDRFLLLSPSVHLGEWQFSAWLAASPNGDFSMRQWRFL